MITVLILGLSKRHGEEEACIGVIGVVSFISRVLIYPDCKAGHVAEYTTTVPHVIARIPSPFEGSDCPAVFRFLLSFYGSKFLSRQGS
jgi:hypothetical protein